MSKYPHAVIFAGGKSSRMGEDKALIHFANHSTLSQYQYARLTSLFENVSLLAKNDKFDFDCDVLYDRYKESSPLVGIVSLFESLDVEYVFILSVDAPFVSKEVIDTLFAFAKQEKFDAIVAQSPSGVQALCGVYHKSILPVAKAQLQQGKHKLQDLLHLAHTHYEVFEDDSLFINLNTPSEYKEALAIVGR